MSFLAPRSFAPWASLRLCVKHSVLIRAIRVSLFAFLPLNVRRSMLDVPEFQCFSLSAFPFGGVSVPARRPTQSTLDVRCSMFDVRCSIFHPPLHAPHSAEVTRRRIPISDFNLSAFSFNPKTPVFWRSHLHQPFRQYNVQPHSECFVPLTAASSAVCLESAFAQSPQKCCHCKNKKARVCGTGGRGQRFLEG
jgi:hypothetical protein